MSGAGGGVLLPHVGLCSICLHTRRVESRRGSAFFMCTRGQSDPSFPRYPRLPVLACRGFEPQGMGDTQPRPPGTDGP